MNIVSYNWGDESTNQVGICLSNKGNKVMVWCDEGDYHIEGASERRYQHFGGGEFSGEPTGGEWRFATSP